MHPDERVETKTLMKAVGLSKVRVETVTTQNKRCLSVWEAVNLVLFIEWKVDVASFNSPASQNSFIHIFSSPQLSNRAKRWFPLQVGSDSQDHIPAKGMN